MLICKYYKETIYCNNTFSIELKMIDERLVFKYRQCCLTFINSNLKSYLSLYLSLIKIINWIEAIITLISTGNGVPY